MSDEDNEDDDDDTVRFGEKFRCAIGEGRRSPLPLLLLMLLLWDFLRADDADDETADADAEEAAPDAALAVAHEATKISLPRAGVLLAS